MFNYKYKSSMTYWTYNPSAQGFIVLAKEDIVPGQEVVFACIV